jgi:fibronectin-binding autotransporter adhesin
MTGVIQPGHTLHVHGTLASGTVLIADAGTGTTPGGVIDVLGTTVNYGAVVLDGSRTSGAQGATATIERLGVLTNVGLLKLCSGGGDNSGYGSGAALQVLGTLNNAGVLRDGTGYSGDAATLTIAHGGVLQNEGKLYVVSGDSGVPYSNLTPAPGATLTDAGKLTNSGSLFVQGGTTFAHTAGDGAVINLTGVLVNSGLIDLEGGVDAGSYDGGSPTGATLSVQDGLLYNTGRIVVGAATALGSAVGNAAAGALLETTDLQNFGSVLVQGSTGADGVAPPSGTLDILPGLHGRYSDDYHSLSIGGGVTGASGAGGLGGVVMIDDFFTNYAPIDIAGGEGSTDPAALGTGGTMDLLSATNFENYSLIDIHGGLAAPSGGAPGYGGGGGVLVVGSFFRNIYTSVINVEAGVGGSAASMTVAPTGYLFNYTMIENDGLIVNNGLLHNLATIENNGTILNYASFRNYGTIEGSGTIENRGLLQTESRSTIAVASIVNDGEIGVGTNGAVTLGGAITADPGASGHIIIAAGGVLTIDGAVASDQTIVFGGADATLALADASAFAGVIDGFSTTSAIDFLGLDITAAHSYGAALGIDLRNGSTLDLKFGALLANYATLSLTTDGHGGTDLMLRPTAAAESPSAGLASLAPAGPSAQAADGLRFGPAHTSLNDNLTVQALIR